MDKHFWYAAAIRAIRTMAQTAIAVIGSAVVLEDVSWATVVSASALAGVLAILTAVAAGLPEVPVEIWEEEELDEEDAEGMEEEA